MRAASSDSTTWVQFSRRWQGAKLTTQELSSWPEHIFSYHEVLTNCSQSAMVSRVPLEPLVGDLRFPGATCIPDRGRAFRKGQTLRQDHLLPIPLQLQAPLPRRALFFDLGASIYASGLGSASQIWFVNAYHTLGVEFDRIFAWEQHVWKPEEIFGKPMPLKVLDRLSYFNVPVNATPGHRHNPLRMLRAIARRDDFVVIKIDIDAPRIEQSLVEQILDDAELASLIDELYYEHHVWKSPLVHMGWISMVRQTKATLRDSYELFGRLRELGIRAHSWV